jgi:hypothetical protein
MSATTSSKLSMLMMSWIRIDQTSSDASHAFATSTTMPALICVERCGCSAGLPPVTASTVGWQSDGRPVTGQRTGSGTKSPSTNRSVCPEVCCVYSSGSEGALKPRPAEARSSSVGASCQRSASFGLTELPKSL